MQKMEARMRVVVAAGLAAGLAGCISNRESAERDFQTYVGNPVTHLVLKQGPPTAQFDMGDGRRAFQWRLSANVTSGGTASRIGSMIIFSPTQTDTITCVATFFARRSSPGDNYTNWKVVGFAPPGENCG